jgi:hypothetical protein
LPMPEIAPPPLGLVGPVEVRADPPALLLPVFGLTLGVNGAMVPGGDCAGRFVAPKAADL